MQASSPLLLQSLACCFKKQRGLHYKHRDSQSQCFVLHNSKHQRNVLVCFTLITLSCKKRAKGSFSWSWKSNWKERNVKGKKHFSKATLPCARARRNEDENWEGFLLASKKMEKVLESFSDLWNTRKELWKQKRLIWRNQSQRWDFFCAASSCRHHFFTNKRFLLNNKILSSSYRTTKMILCFSEI